MAANSKILTLLGIGPLLLLPLGAQAGDSRTPLAGGPLTTLPKVNAPKAPQPSVQIQTGKPNSSLESLLAKPVTPRQFAIEGVKALPFNRVAEPFSALVGKTITVADLIKAANAVTKLYQEHGYVLSFCFIPAQDFAEGKVRVTVVEGYVAKMAITGNAGAAEGKIRDIAAAMLRDVPLKRATFERTINLLSQLPGLKISAVVPPPQTVGGATELQLDVSRKPITVGTGLLFNQPGVRGMFTVNANSLTPLAEQITLSVLAPRGRDNEEYYAAAYAQPLGSDGLQVRVDASHYHGRPQNAALQNLSLARIVATDKLAATFSYPFLLNNTRNLTGSFTAYAADNTDKYQNTQTSASLTSKSNVRVVQGDLAYAAVSPGKTLRLSLGLAKGFDALGANRDTSASLNPGQTIPGHFDLNFTKVLAQAAQSNDWPLQLGTVAAFTGQYSRATLPSSEQISFGGARFGLGYPVGEIAGDSGWGASFEVNRGFAVDTAYLKQLKPYLLYDTAQVHLNQTALQHRQIASVAAGLRLTDNQHYNLDLSIARPVGSAPVESGSRSPRVNASFSYQFN